MKKQTLYNIPDKDLVFLLKNEDEAAFAEIYNRYWSKLYYIAHRNTKCQELSEEIVQDVFLTVWRKRHVLEIQSVPVYLAAMVRYSVYKSFAKEKRNKEYESAVQYSESFVDTIESDIENKLLLEIISDLSNHLPEKCRLVFQYNKLQDRSLSEVAIELNISQKTAEAHLTKALKVIRGNLGNAYHILF